jgi:hypothetical protein
MEKKPRSRLYQFRLAFFVAGILVVATLVAWFWPEVSGLPPEPALRRTGRVVFECWLGIALLAWMIRNIYRGLVEFARGMNEADAASDNDQHRPKK